MPDSPTRDITYCARCGGRIRIAITEYGNRQPVDADQHPDGNLALKRDVTGRLLVRNLTQERPTLEYAEWRGKDHRAICADPQPRTPARSSRRRPRVRPTGWPR